MNVREIELKCAQPGEDVLDRLELERSQDRNIKLHEFYEGITAAQEFRKIDINGMIEQIAANQELSPRVKDEAVRRISIARENLSTGEDQS
jgi:DNA repair protein SbcD/Mre11